MRRLSLIGWLFPVLLWGCTKQQQPQKIQANAHTGKTVRFDNNAAVTYTVSKIARITGISLPGETLPNPNQTQQYDVGGTDLGIMWAMGNGKIGMFFGDTFGNDWSAANGGGGNGSNWRSNVLAFSTDQNLDDGLTFSGMATDSSGKACEIIPSPHNTSGNGSYTSIPTAAIRVNGVDYVHYMDVRQWGVPGSWVTNSSGIYSSSDDGKTWVKCTTVTFASASKFAQAAYADKDGYVYMMGTPSGRNGAAYLARFAEADILNQPAYQYWGGSAGWVSSETNAVSVIDAPVGELSLVFNTKYNLWLVTYLDGQNYQIILRYASSLTGPWSGTKMLVNGNDYPGLYGGFIYPYNNNGDDLYFTVSMWPYYNVFLAKAHINSMTE
jgi:hypothetical protein